MELSWWFQQRASHAVSMLTGAAGIWSLTGLEDPLPRWLLHVATGKTPCWMPAGCLSSSQCAPLYRAASVLWLHGSWPRWEIWEREREKERARAQGGWVRTGRERAHKEKTSVFYLFGHVLFIGSESLSPDNAQEMSPPLQRGLSKNFDIL